jgi:aminoglycoside phosphotransferase (APT) family kinase protein
MTLDPTDPKDRRNKYREFDPALISSFLGDRTISRSERISTGKSNTNIKLELSDGITVVARLYSENSWSNPEREKLIANMIDNRVPIPKMLANGNDWTVLEFVEGNQLDAQPEHSGAAARAIAQLTQVTFETGGWITEKGQITAFDFGDDYYGSQLEHAEVRNWLGPERIPLLSKILANETPRFTEISQQPSLAHGDFNPTNVLIHEGEVSAVLDWEYCHAGTPYMDIGNLLRNTESKYHESIGRGLVEGGFDLPNDWKQRAALIDFSSHLEFLSSARSDEFKRTRIGLIDSFIDMFNS